jgi:hypothetical protein
MVRNPTLRYRLTDEKKVVEKPGDIHCCPLSLKVAYNFSVDIAPVEAFSAEIPVSLLVDLWSRTKYMTFNASRAATYINDNATTSPMSLGLDNGLNTLGPATVACTLLKLASH